MSGNAIIDTVRESWDPYDGRGCALNALFAIADGLCVAGEWVPGDWGYRPSPFLHSGGMDGADYMATEYDMIGADVWAALERGDADEVRDAGRALHMLVTYADRVAS